VGKQRVALVVFAEIESEAPDIEVDPLIASTVLRHLIRKSLPFGPNKHKVFWTMNEHTYDITIHEAMEVGSAAGNGYLWTELTSEAFRGQTWQSELNGEVISSDDVHPAVEAAVEEMISMDLPSEAPPKGTVKQTGRKPKIPTTKNVIVDYRDGFPAPQPGIEPIFEDEEFREE
jgi:hypothetical protein